MFLCCQSFTKLLIGYVKSFDCWFWFGLIVILLLLAVIFGICWLRSVVVEIVLFDEWIVCLGLCCLLWVFVGYFINFLCFVSICFWVVYKILSFFFIFFCFSVWWFGNKPATLHSQTTKEGSGKREKSWDRELERVVY